MLGECGFDLRTLGVFAIQEPPFHLSSIFCLRPFAPVGTRVEFNDSLSDAQNLARVGMVFLAVKASVTQTGINRRVARSVLKQWTPKNTIVSRAASNACREDQMRLGVAADAQFGPVALAARFFAYARLVMFAGMAFFKTGRVDSDASWLFKEIHRSMPGQEVGRTMRGKASRGVWPSGTALNNAVPV